MLEQIIIFASLILNQNSQHNFSQTPINIPSAEINLNLEQNLPKISAQAAIVYDHNQNKILFQKNANQKLPIASLTKLVTALIIAQEHNMSEIVTVTPQGINTVPVIAYLQNGEKITVQNLLHAMLIRSANDSARVLAIHNSGSISQFAEKMNTYVRSLGLKSSYFTNPSGLNTSQNLSTASDLLTLARHVIKNSELLNITHKEGFTFTDETNRISHDIKTTNKLLSSEYNVVGLKTGTTPEAGQCYITITQEADPKIVILLNSPNRFQESKLLLDWATQLPK